MKTTVHQSGSWRPSRGLLQLSGQEVIPGLGQGGSREVIVRTHFNMGHTRLSAGLVDRLNVRSERKRSQEKLRICQCE